MVKQGIVLLFMVSKSSKISYYHRINPEFESKKRDKMATVIKKGASKSEIAKSIRKAVRKRPSKEITKLAGTLKADIDPLAYQKILRDEWK